MLETVREVVHNPVYGHTHRARSDSYVLDSRGVPFRGRVLPTGRLLDPEGSHLRDGSARPGIRTATAMARASSGQALRDRRRSRSGRGAPRQDRNVAYRVAKDGPSGVALSMLPECGSRRYSISSTSVGILDPSTGSSRAGTPRAPIDRLPGSGNACSSGSRSSTRSRDRWHIRATPAMTRCDRDPRRRRPTRSSSLGSSQSGSGARSGSRRSIETLCSGSHVGRMRGLYGPSTGPGYPRTFETTCSSSWSRISHGSAGSAITGELGRSRRGAESPSARIATSSRSRSSVPLRKAPWGTVVTPCAKHRGGFADPWCLRCYPIKVAKFDLRSVVKHVPGQMRLFDPEEMGLA